jgi:hypothetical protein
MEVTDGIKIMMEEYYHSERCDLLLLLVPHNE